MGEKKKMPEGHTMDETKTSENWPSTKRNFKIIRLSKSK